MRIGNKIARYRKLRRWTQEDLAKATGLSKGYITSIEGGERRPSIKTLAIIAMCLGVPIEKLKG